MPQHTRNIFLVRHGPTHAKGMIGWTDLPADLSDRAKVLRLNAFLPPQAWLVSSDLLRARQTADAIGARRIRLDHHRGLREMHFGRWEGREFDSFEGDEAKALLEFYEKPGEPSPPEGESWNSFFWRTNAAIDEILTRHPKGDLIFVVHLGVILAAMQRATAVSAYEAHSYKADPLSVSHFTENEKIIDLIALNQII